MIKYSKALKASAILENPPRRQLRKQYIFMLSYACDEAIDRLAHTYECSRSHVIERMLALDYADLFHRFRKGDGFVDVVIETGLDPDRVRFAFSEYKRGFEEVSLEESELLDKKLLLALARISSMEVTPSAKGRSIDRLEVTKRGTREELEDRKAELETAIASNRARIERLRSLHGSHSPGSGEDP
jgi:hypothetical protein